MAYLTEGLFGCSFDRSLQKDPNAAPARILVEGVAQQAEHTKCLQRGGPQSISGSTGSRPSSLRSRVERTKDQQRDGHRPTFEITRSTSPWISKAATQQTLQKNTEQAVSGSSAQDDSPRGPSTDHIETPHTGAAPGESVARALQWALKPMFNNLATKEMMDEVQTKLEDSLSEMKLSLINTIRQELQARNTSRESAASCETDGSTSHWKLKRSKSEPAIFSLALVENRVVQCNVVQFGASKYFEKKQSVASWKGQLHETPVSPVQQNMKQLSDLEQRLECITSENLPQRVCADCSHSVVPDPVPDPAPEPSSLKLMEALPPKPLEGDVIPVGEGLQRSDSRLQGKRRNTVRYSPQRGVSCDTVELDIEDEHNQLNATMESSVSGAHIQRMSLKSVEQPTKAFVLNFRRFIEVKKILDVLHEVIKINTIATLTLVFAGTSPQLAYTAFFLVFVLVFYSVHQLGYDKFEINGMLATATLLDDRPNKDGSRLLRALSVSGTFGRKLSMVSGLFFLIIAGLMWAHTLLKWNDIAGTAWFFPFEDVNDKEFEERTTLLLIGTLMIVFHSAFELVLWRETQCCANPGELPINWLLGMPSMWFSSRDHYEEFKCELAKIRDPGNNGLAIGHVFPGEMAVMSLDLENGGRLRTALLQATSRNNPLELVYYDNVGEGDFLVPEEESSLSSTLGC